MGTRHRTLFSEQSVFFVTTTCHEWLPLLRDDRYFELLYKSLEFLSKKYKAEILAYAFMPNHLHLILYFTDEYRLSEYMRDFKKYTSTHIRKLLEEDGEKTLLSKLRFMRGRQRFKVWMDRFDDVYIKSRKVMEAKVNYIHNNPVDYGLAAYPEQYDHSSAKFYFLNEQVRLPVLDWWEVVR